MPTKVEEPQPTKPDPPPEKDTFTKEIEEMQQKFQAAFKAPVRASNAISKQDLRKIKQELLPFEQKAEK